MPHPLPMLRLGCPLPMLRCSGMTESGYLDCNERGCTASIDRAKFDDWLRNARNNTRFSGTDYEWMIYQYGQKTEYDHSIAMLKYAHNERDIVCKAFYSVRNEALDEAAKACEARFMGDMNREDMEARRCAEAIRKLKTGE